MRNLDDVTGVTAREVRAQAGEHRTPGGGAGAATDSQRPQDIQDCIGSSRVTKFDMLVEFGGASPRRGRCGCRGPAGSAAPAAAAQGAVEQGAEATAAAGGAE